MEYYSAIKGNETGSFVMMWMNLESVIQNEISQKEKNKYCGIEKNGTVEPICRAGIEKRLMNMVGQREGESGMN